MITLNLKNFQAHSDTSLNIQGGFCCILGATNSGKTSIVRSLKWLLYNSLRGNRFIRFGEKSAQVSLTFDDTSIQRSKGPGDNSYKAGNLKLDTIGASGVPAEVAKALNIQTLCIDTDDELELNIGTQLESPFLLMEPDSYKAKAVNVLTGGNVFDSAIRETKRKIKECEDGCKKSDEQVSLLTTQLSGYADLDNKEKLLADIETKLVRFEQLQKTIADIESANSQLMVITTDVSSVKTKLQNIDPILNYVEQCMVRLEYVETCIKALEDHSQLSVSCNLVDMELRELNKQIAEATRALMEMPDAPCDLCGQTITTDVRKRLV